MGSDTEPHATICRSAVNRGQVSGLRQGTARSVLGEAQVAFAQADEAVAGQDDVVKHLDVEDGAGRPHHTLQALGPVYPPVGRIIHIGALDEPGHGAKGGIQEEFAFDKERVAYGAGCDVLTP